MSDIGGIDPAIALIELDCGCRYGVFAPATIPIVGDPFICETHTLNPAIGRLGWVQDVIEAAPAGKVWGTDVRGSAFVEGGHSTWHPSQGPQT